jgi:hypothetical protein
MGRRILPHAIAVLLTGALAFETLAAQTATTSTTTSTSPVAYVYVSRPTHLDGFAASSSGRLTPVPGSPFSNIAVSHLSVTNKFLFGAGDDNESIFSYAIASNGSVRKVGQINTHNYNPSGAPCDTVGPTQVDFARQTLYNDDGECEDNQYIQSYKIEPSGQLTFLANTGTDSNQLSMSSQTVLGNDQYVYVTASQAFIGDAGGWIEAFRRQSNGSLEPALDNIQLPPTANPNDAFTPDGPVATGPSKYVAVEMEPDSQQSGYADGKSVIASFTAQADGNLITTNTAAEMVAPDVQGYVMSISPTGKLLAIGGGTSGAPPGFQLLRFNNANPITKYSGVLQNKNTFIQFGWDKHNHLYALSNNHLFVYNVTPTSISQAAGSPYSIPEASSLIVLDLP